MKKEEEKPFFPDKAPVFSTSNPAWLVSLYFFALFFAPKNNPSRLRSPNQQVV